MASVVRDDVLGVLVDTQSQMVADGVPAVLESPTAGCVHRARAAPGDGGGHGWAATASPGTNPGHLWATSAGR